MFCINTNDIYPELERYSLTPEQYELCLEDISRKINKVTDEDWQDILDRYGINMHYDTIRKASQTIFGGAFVSDYMFIKKSESKTQLAKAKELAPDASIFAYGNFITVLINFILLAFVVFLLIKGINKMKKEEAPAPEAPAGPTQEQLLAEIRDLLKK